jgi:hypothetical protein
MMKRIGVSFSLLASLLCSLLISANSVSAQQTLGAITGTVTDTSGAVISNALVTLVGDQTQYTRTQNTSDAGSYLFSNLLNRRRYLRSRCRRIGP